MNDIARKNNVKIKILSSMAVNSPFCNGSKCRRYTIKISRLNNELNSFNSVYYDSVYNFNNRKMLNKDDVLYSLLIDCQAYDNAPDINDFADEFGYTDVKQLLKVYEGCQETSFKMHNLFSDDDLQQLFTDFQDY